MKAAKIISIAQYKRCGGDGPLCSFVILDETINYGHRSKWQRTHTHTYTHGKGEARSAYTTKIEKNNNTSDREYSGEEMSREREKERKSLFESSYNICFVCMFLPNKTCTTKLQTEEQYSQKPIIKATRDSTQTQTHT